MKNIKQTIKLAIVAAIFALPGISQAAVIDAYVGFDFVGSSQAQMELRSFTYTAQGNGPPGGGEVIFNTPLLSDRGLGLGTSSRLNGEMVSIDWSDFTGIPYPAIWINTMTYANSAGGGELTASFGDLYLGYYVGLIDGSTGDTELQCDTLLSCIPNRSDIYDISVNGTVGNAPYAYLSENNLQSGAIILSFASAGPTTVVPIPAAVWLFGSALGLLGWTRKKVKVTA